MRRLLYVTISLLCVMGAGLAYAQGGWIQLAADPYGISCQYSNATGSFNFVYQIHQSSPGTTLSRYALVPSNPAAFVWVFDNYLPNAHIGSAPTGVTVAYGACKASPWVIGFSGYTMSATTQCEWLDFAPHPDATTGMVESIDCTLPTPVTYEAGCAILVYRPPGAACNVPCGAILGGGYPCGHAVPVRDTSWGRVKTLYY